MIKISLKDEVAFAYNQEKKKLVIIFQDDNNIIYSIGGWFGIKLYEFLKEDGDLKAFLIQDDFKDSHDLQMTFQRLIRTLTDKGITKDDYVLSVKPFSEEECLDFGKGEFTGSLSIKEISINELIASADILPFYGYHCHPVGGSNCH